MAILLNKLRAEILTELSQGRVMAFDSYSSTGHMIGRYVQSQTVSYFISNGLLKIKDETKTVGSFGNGYIISSKGNEALNNHNAKKRKETSLLQGPPDPASLDQLKYADKLGIQLPLNATTKEDLTCLISNKTSYDKPSTQRHRNWAARYNIKVSEFIGKKGLFNLIQNELTAPGNEKKLLAWFAFRVYRGIVNGAMDVSIQDPQHLIMQNIAERFINNEKILKSIHKYKGSDLIWFGTWSSPDGMSHTGGSTKTAAYKEISIDLKMRI